MSRTILPERRTLSPERRIRRSELGVRRSGMLLLELMISLAISVTLLVAVAAAYSASTAAIEINAHFFTATQAARVSMDQMLSMIRRSETCQLDDSDSTVTSSTNLVVTINGSKFTYQYASSPTDQLQFVQNSRGDTIYVLSSNVTSLQFTADLGLVGSQTPRPSRVSVDMTVTVGNESVRLTGSAVPRSMITYK